MRSRHRLSKFLLRRGQRFPSRAWTQPHERWLGKLRFEDAPSQATFIDYCAAVQALVQRRRTLIGVLEQTVPESSHAQTVARLRCFRGIDTLTAAGLCAEVGDFARFAKPALLSGFLGVVPSEYTSTRSAPKARSPRPGHRTPAGCSSRPPTTTVTGPRSVRASPLARPAKTRVSCRSRGAPAPPARRWTHLAGHARQAHRDGRDRLRARARRVLLGGRDPGLTPHRHPPRRSGGCRGAHEQPERADTSPINGPANTGYGQPAISPTGWRPLLDCEPGDEQGS